MPEDPQESGRLSANGDASRRVPEDTPGARGPALVADSLVKRYAAKNVVDGVSFTLSGGELLGLLGPNGAGKTTIVQMLYGITVPSSGSIRFGELMMPRDQKAIRKILGIVPQEDSLDTDFNAYDNLLRFVHHAGVVGDAAHTVVSQNLERVGLRKHADKMIEQLSGGMKRRLVLARALLSHPRVLFLDEPTTGLDPDARQTLWRVVKALKEEGTAILLTTHYMEEASRLCDRILLLKDGKVVDEGAPLQLVTRFVGDEVLEVEGLNQEQASEMADRLGGWYQRMGGSFVIPLSGAAAEAELESMRANQRLSITRRKGNLEDVFLKLTGEHLSGEE